MANVELLYNYSMANRWSHTEEQTYREQLVRLYVTENKTIHEIGKLLGISESSVYKRLQRLEIQSTPETKTGYLNVRKDIHIPLKRTVQLAEFFGIMLGDGHVSRFQTVVTLGTKELEYVEYVADLMLKLFRIRGTIHVRSDGYRDVYIGSVTLTNWLRAEGLVPNKVSAQVEAPEWIYEKKEWMRAFLRGFFDTDGSIYRLRFGRQISLCNKSIPLLYSLQRMLIELGYKASAVSAFRVYLTRRTDIDRFFREIRPANTKHVRRHAAIGT